MTESGPASGGFTEKLNYLFATIRRPNGEEYSNNEVAKACTNYLAEHGTSKEYEARIV